MNIANGTAKVESPSPHVSIFNFHYATPPDAVAANAHLRGVIGENETGFRGKDDVLYRTEGWAFLLAGGGIYNNLDYSFTPAHPDGTFLDYTSPGGGNPTFRKQMRILKDFVHSFDFVRMKPDRSVVTAPEGLAVQALVERAGSTRLSSRAGGEGNFAARWTGRIDPPASGTYRLTTVSDDGVRLWLDGKLVIENWTDHAPSGDHATVQLAGGGGSKAQLSWTRPDGTTEVIPAATPTAGRQRTGPAGRVLRGPHVRRAAGRPHRPGDRLRVAPGTPTDPAEGRLPGRGVRPRPPGRALPGRVGRPEDRKGPEGRVPGAHRWPQDPDFAGFRRGSRAGRPHPLNGSTAAAEPRAVAGAPGVC